MAAMSADDLSKELKDRLGDGLVSVALIGSAAADQQTKRFSNINVLAIVRDASTVVLAAIAPAIRRWRKAGHPAPVILSQTELERSRDVFPIEAGDIRDRHRVLYGADLYQSITTKPADVRRQLEFELRSKLVTLRTAYLANAGKDGALRDVAAASLSSFAVLFEAVLRALGDAGSGRKPDLWRAIAKHTGRDAEPLETLWRLRDGGKAAADDTGERLFGGLVGQVAGVVDLVDRMDESEEGKS
jgi:hypothetical protein